MSDFGEPKPPGLPLCRALILAEADEPLRGEENKTAKILRRAFYDEGPADAVR